MILSTLAQLAGLDIGGGEDGQSFSKAMDEPDTVLRDHVIHVFPRGQDLRACDSNGALPVSRMDKFGAAKKRSRNGSFMTTKWIRWRRKICLQRHPER